MEKSREPDRLARPAGHTYWRLFIKRMGTLDNQAKILVVDADLVAHVFYINQTSQIVWATRVDAQWSSQVISGSG